MKRSMSTAAATLSLPVSAGRRRPSTTVPAVAQPIITPEAVVLDFDRAGVASRTLAMLVDFLALSRASGWWRW